jgi:uncharacterized protein YndB with AHSA1/START domain
MRIYARALTASEILDVWGGAPPEEPPLGSAKLRAGGKMTIRGKFSL